jgi:serine/threonine protein kinase/formylglycine-generating enzyme required for sulfatase activity
VYLAYDAQLQRFVAIKVPHPNRVPAASDVEFYLTEARTVANLDHPHIVPVFDVGSTPDFPCFIVSRFIEGRTLTQHIKDRQPAFDKVAELIATIADALHYAHRQGLVHRDIKPSNILIDKTGKPFLVDFGLALREENVGQGPRFAGTRAYMSPEQARGEGHRVDGRSDIFSLGIVLYEMLTGRLPFQASSREEQLDQIANREVRPPRQWNDSVPKELERICMTALSKRASERYTTAKDMADDLRHLLTGPSADEKPTVIDPEKQEVETPAPMPGRAPSSTDHQAVKIVPKGLRSFDATDADFFLELLPGPRDREGLPENIRFWKARIEATDADSTFPVGLIYGPSGCGKSSLLKAGLLPRLSKAVTAVYLEATEQETEARLLKGLKRQVPDLPSDLSLVDSLTALRRGRFLESGQKVLLVLDQFEQWLHAKRNEANPELVQSFRQTNGENVQVILMVRDDFWMSVSRLFDALEINLDRARNARAVDLFDVDHARRVLRLFGQAYGRLVLEPKELPTEQARFLDRAVAELNQDGRVVPVRLSLFAEMMKDRPWNSATLDAVGGAKGIGVRFLEETFSSRTASPDLRVLEKSARALLHSLLPERGTNIRGGLRSRHDVAAASELADDSPRFRRLLEILDRELHIITPTEAEEPRTHQSTNITPGDATGYSSGTEHDTASYKNASYYQLTHDYLIPALRQWLSQEKRRAWRGRAELRLEERTAEWSRSPEHRFLPTALEYTTIALGVPARRRTQQQQALMRAARQFHVVRFGGGLVLLLLLGALSAYIAASVRREHAEQLTDALFNTSPEGVSVQIERLRPYQSLAEPLLGARFSISATPFRQRLRAACALAAFGQVEKEFLIESIATAPAAECKNIMTALSPFKTAVADQLLGRANRQDIAVASRVRYATVLLQFGDPRAAQAMLAEGRDPSTRTAFIHSFKSWHGDFRPLAQFLRRSNDAALRSGLCAALGLVDPGNLDNDEKATLEEVLVNVCQHDADAGTHSAAGFVLTKWQAPSPELAPSSKAAGGQRWFVNHCGMTMLEIKAGTFPMGDLANVGFRSSSASLVGLLGSPPGPWPLAGGAAFAAIRKHYRSDDWPHLVTLSGPFFMCDRKITVRDFEQFMADGSAEKPSDWPGPNPKVSPTSDSPIQNVTWYDALLFCNWLSKKEGLQPCYQRAQTNETGRVVGTKGQKDIDDEIWQWNSAARGYRLPTEAEWEYACRAGTRTKYSFGDSVSHLLDYAVFRDIHVQPGGSRLPNSWGLFDIHGNGNEWCWDRFGAYNGDPTVDPTGANIGTQRAVRGGTYLGAPETCVSAYRFRAAPSFRGAAGFRVVCDRH